MTLNFNLHTYDIQYLVIALINSQVCCNGDTVITEADYSRLHDRLTELNRLCTKKNGYTLAVTVDDAGGVI